MITDVWWWHLNYHFLCVRGIEKIKHTTSTRENRSGSRLAALMTACVNRLRGDDLSVTVQCLQMMTKLLKIARDWIFKARPSLDGSSLLDSLVKARTCMWSIHSSFQFVCLCVVRGELVETVGSAIIQSVLQNWNFRETPINSTSRFSIFPLWFSFSKCSNGLG